MTAEVIQLPIRERCMDDEITDETVDFSERFCVLLEQLAEETKAAGPLPDDFRDHLEKVTTNARRKKV